MTDLFVWGPDDIPPDVAAALAQARAEEKARADQGQTQGDGGRTGPGVYRQVRDSHGLTQWDVRRQWAKDNLPWLALGALAGGAVGYAVAGPWGALAGLLIVVTLLYLYGFDVHPGGLRGASGLAGR